MGDRGFFSYQLSAISYQLSRFIFQLISQFSSYYHDYLADG
jgi:hypothetical protein